MKPVFWVTLFGLFCVFSVAKAASSFEVDMTFTQSRGAVVVVDGWNKMGKSDLNVQDIAAMQRTVRQLEDEVRRLQDRIARLEKR